LMFLYYCQYYKTRQDPHQTGTSLKIKQLLYFPCPWKSRERLKIYNAVAYFDIFSMKIHRNHQQQASTSIT